MKQSCDKLLVKFKQRVAVVSRITNNCIVISVVSVKCEQWHESSENNKEFNWNRTHICFYLVCNKRTHIKTFLKVKNVTKRSWDISGSMHWTDIEWLVKEQNLFHTDSPYDLRINCIPCGQIPKHKSKCLNYLLQPNNNFNCFSCLILSLLLTFFAFLCYVFFCFFFFIRNSTILSNVKMKYGS